MLTPQRISAITKQVYSPKFLSEIKLVSSSIPASPSTKFRALRAYWVTYGCLLVRMTTRELVQMLLLKQLIYFDQSLERGSAQPVRLVESLAALSEAELLDIDAAISAMPLQLIKNLCWVTARVIAGNECNTGRLPLVAEIVGTQPFNVQLVVRQLARFHLKGTTAQAETYLWRAIASGLVPIDLSVELRFTERLARVSRDTFISFNPFAQALLKRFSVRDQLGAATHARF